MCWAAGGGTDNLLGPSASDHCSLLASCGFVSLATGHLLSMPRLLPTLETMDLVTFWKTGKLVKKKRLNMVGGRCNYCKLTWGINEAQNEPFGAGISPPGCRSQMQTKPVKVSVKKH